MNRLVGHVVALFTIAVWGVTFVSTKLLLQHFSAEEILFIRFFLGWLAFWFVVPHPLPWQGWRTELMFAVAGLFGITLYFLLENIALEYTRASNVAIIVATVPFFTALVDWLCFGGMRPGWQFFTGFSLAMLGIVLLTIKDASFNVSPMGDMLALLAALAWAFYSPLARKLTALNLGNAKTTRGIFFYGILLMLPVLVVTPHDITLGKLLLPACFGNFLFLGLIASALCFATWNFCLIRLGTAQASAYIYLVPVITVICASVILNETVSISMGLGMLLVIGGLILSERHGRKA